MSALFRRPPRLAVWLLDRIGYTRQNPALAGDLLEEFRSGRSAGWFWRQTLAAIAAGFPLPYLLAVSAGFAAQFSVSYALWSAGWPARLAQSGWAQVGLWCLMQAAGGVASVAPMKSVLGQWSVRLRPMFCAAGGDTQKRSTILGLACYESFSFGLWSYGLCAMIFRRFSRPEFVKYEAIWFVLWVLTPAVLPAMRSSAADREPWLAMPQVEPVVTVALRDGRAIVLERDRLAESVFEAADPELIGVVFGRGRSLELLRRAIWLGGYRSHSHIQGRAEIFTISGLANLMDETRRVNSVLKAATNDRSAWVR